MIERFSHGGLAVAFALFFGAGSASAEALVRAHDGKVDVTARSEPLTAVLEAFAEQTGARVTFGGSPPKRSVTVTLRDYAPARALEEILEGLGVSYALRTDESGQSVEAVHVVGITEAGTAAGGPPPPSVEPEGEWNDVDEPPALAEPEDGEDLEPPETAAGAGMWRGGTPDGTGAAPEPPLPPGSTANDHELPPGMTASPPGEDVAAPQGIPPGDERVLPPPPTASPAEIGPQTPPPGMTLPKKSSGASDPER